MLGLTDIRGTAFLEEKITFIVEANTRSALFSADEVCVEKFLCYICQLAKRSFKDVIERGSYTSVKLRYWCSFLIA